jgi:flagellin
VAGGDLKFTKTDGSTFDVVVADTFNTAGGFAGADMDTGTSTVAADATPYNIGTFSFKVGSGAQVDITNATSAQDFVDQINASGNVYAAIDSTTGVLKLSSNDSLTIVAGAGATSLGLTAGTYRPSGDLTTVNVKSPDNANDAIQRIDSALTSVSTLRSTLGAIQNRFQSTINSLSAVSENLSASRSRILDTDFAAETAALTRAQILQQAGTAMVAQANSVPQNVLSLLRATSNQ